MTNTAYQKFVKRWEEVMDLPPQTAGPLTPLYKILVKRFKVMPWPAFILVSIMLVVAIYLLVGSAITFLVSLLQKGF